MPRHNWILIALLDSPNETLSPVQLQKSLFLLGDKNSDAVGNDYYHFDPYNYGPFSKLIYQDIEILEKQDLVRTRVDNLKGWREYSLTPSGEAKAVEVKTECDPDAVAYLDRAVEWATGLTFAQLVSKIYEEYPEYKSKSLFQN